MYLVARQESQSFELINLLAENGYTATWLPLMTTRINMDKYLELKTIINNHDKIFITAPAVIDYLAEELQTLNRNVTILTPGLASASKISKVSQVKHIYPVCGSGIDAIDEEQMLEAFHDSTMLVIGGDKINPKLKVLLNRYNIKFYYSCLYKRVNLAVENPDVIHKYISDPQIKGIIITSKLIAEYLLEYINKTRQMERLKQLPIISIHKQITEYLFKNGMSYVCETANSDNLSILQTIRDFENE